MLNSPPPSSQTQQSLFDSSPPSQSQAPTLQDLFRTLPQPSPSSVEKTSPQGESTRASSFGPIGRVSPEKKGGEGKKTDGQAERLLGMLGSFGGKGEEASSGKNAVGRETPSAMASLFASM